MRLCAILFLRSYLTPNLSPGIVRMQTRVFAQQFFGALVLDHRSLNAHFHQLIAARSRTDVEDALLAQAEYLAVLGSLRNLEQRPPVNGGNLDFGPQAGFVDADRNGDFDIVPIATEERMRFH